MRKIEKGLYFSSDDDEIMEIIRKWPIEHFHGKDAFDFVHDSEKSKDDFAVFHDYEGWKYILYGFFSESHHNSDKGLVLGKGKTKEQLHKYASGLAMSGAISQQAYANSLIYLSATD